MRARRVGFRFLSGAVSQVRVDALHDVGLETVAAFGPTDAGLVHAATRESLALFTADTELDRYARRTVNVLSWWQLRDHPDRPKG